MKNKGLIAIAVATLLTTNVIAQNKKENFSVGLQFGTIEYSGEVGKEIFSFDTGIHPSFGLNVAKYITPSFNLRGSFRYGMIDGSNAVHNFENKLLDINVLLDYKFNNGYILKETSMIAPYIFIGAGDAISVYTNRNTGVKEQPLAYFNIPMGAGLKFNLTSKMAISLETHYNYAITDELDGVISNDNKWDDSFLYNSIGFNYNFSVGADSDGDGVKDKDDKCPNIAGPANGCPDTDGDGVADIEDKCPNIAGKENGCPVQYFEHVAVMQKAQKGLFFNTGSSVIKEESFVVLDRIAKLLNANKKLKLDISGHTDNTGGEDINLKISNERAAAAKAYIESKGIDASRITSKGYGDSKPVADNATEEGRTQNRRVEFKIKY
mgnify:CR=1 FL=1